MIKQGIEATTRTHIGNVAADAAMHAPCRIIILDEDVPESFRDFCVHEGWSWEFINERLRGHVELIERQRQGGGRTGEE